MTKIWSQGRRPSSLDWKMIFVPSAAREASAFWPPKVSWRTLARNFSSPGARSEGDPDEGTAATAAGDRAGGEQAAATATAARNTTGRSFRPQAFVSRIPSPQPAARFAGDVACGHGRRGSEARGDSSHSLSPAGRGRRAGAERVKTGIRLPGAFLRTNLAKPQTPFLGNLPACLLPRRRDHGALNDDLDAPVLRLAARRGVGGDRTCLAIPLALDPVGRNASGDQDRAHGFGPQSRQLQVVIVGAGGVGMSLHQHAAVPDGGQRLRDLRQPLSHRCLDLGLVDVEVDAPRQRHDEAAGLLADLPEL